MFYFLDVILSLVRTKSKGFLSDKTRLNLAISRATQNLIVLGSLGIFGSKGSFFEDIVLQRGSSLKMRDGSAFTSVEQITKIVYDSSIKQLQ